MLIIKNNIQLLHDYIRELDNIESKLNRNNMKDESLKLQERFNDVNEKIIQLRELNKIEILNKTEELRMSEEETKIEEQSVEQPVDEPAVKKKNTNTIKSQVDLLEEETYKMFREKAPDLKIALSLVTRILLRLRKEKKND